MNSKEIVDYMSKAKDVKDWNKKRYEVLDQCTTEFEHRVAISEVDTKGLIVKILGSDVRKASPKPKPIDQPVTEKGASNA